MYEIRHEQFYPILFAIFEIFAIITAYTEIDILCICDVWHKELNESAI